MPGFDICDDLQEPARKKIRVTDECHQDGNECEEGGYEVGNVPINASKPKIIQEQADELKRENEALESSVCTLKDQMKGERKIRDDILSQNRQLKDEVRKLNQRFRQHEDQRSQLCKHIRGRDMTVGFLRKYIDQNDATENGHKELVPSMQSMCERIISEVHTDPSNGNRKEGISKGGERSVLNSPGIPQIMIDCYAMVCKRMGELRDARDCIEKLESAEAKEKEARQSFEKESDCIRSSLQNDLKSLRTTVDEKEDEAMKHHANRKALERELWEERNAAASIRSELKVTEESMSRLQESETMLDTEVKALRSRLGQNEDSAAKWLADKKAQECQLSEERRVTATIRSELEATKQSLVGLQEAKKVAEAEAKVLRSTLDQNDRKATNRGSIGADKYSLECQLSEERRVAATIRSELEVTKQSFFSLQQSNEALEARSSALQTSLKSAARKAQVLPAKEKELLEAQRRITNLELDLLEEKKSRRKLEEDLLKEERCRENAERELSRQLEENEGCSSGEDDYNAPQALTQMVGHFSSKVGNDHGEDETRVNDHLSKLRKLLEKQVNGHLKRRFSKFRDSEYLLHDRNFSLCKKIEYLEREGRFPKQLIRAMHEMRMMGNDATHGRRAMERRRVEPIVENFTRLNDIFEHGEIPLEQESKNVSRQSSRCVRWS